MSRSIERDQKRFREIVRGKVRRNLRKYVTQREMIGRKGREIFSIPVPNLEIPHFQHGQKGSGGVGHGEGDIGQPVGRGQGKGDGRGGAGNEPGRHIREVEVSLEELADMLGNELELPNIQPKGVDCISSTKDRYTSIRRTGPDSLRHLKRTFKQALKRQIASQHYDPRQPVVVPNRDDERYRSWKTAPEPHTNAAIIYMMDVSGSMSDLQKEIVRIETFWIDTWLTRQYDGVHKRYIVHDVVAHEVDQDTFYRTRENGGTKISSAYHAARAIIDRDFPPADWNIYCFQFSDGDNWCEDNVPCLEFLSDQLLSVSNLFCYGQVKSRYGSGDYIKEIKSVHEEHENLLLSEIPNRDAIYDSIKEFLGTGR